MIMKSEIEALVVAGEAYANDLERAAESDCSESGARVTREEAQRWRSLATAVRSLKNDN